MLPGGLGWAADAQEMLCMPLAGRLCGLDSPRNPRKSTGAVPLCQPFLGFTEFQKLSPEPC